MKCPLNPRQLYEFDLNGYVIIKDFIDSDTCSRINTIVDSVISKRREVYHKFSVIDLHPVLYNLMAHSRTMEICQYMLGDWFRFDHAYGLQADHTTQTGQDLHGGPKANQGSFRYQWFGDRPHCGLLVFSYIMKPVLRGDGGLVMVPGSHKQNIAIEGRQVYHDFLGSTHNAPWVQQPEVNTGDLLLFTEAVVHGTAKWKPADRMRRNLYYKYTPGHLCWRNYDEIKKYADIAVTDLQKDLLRPPFVAGYDEVSGKMGNNNWRGPTRI